MKKYNYILLGLGGGGHKGISAKNVFFEQLPLSSENSLYLYIIYLTMIYNILKKNQKSRYIFWGIFFLIVTFDIYIYIYIYLAIEHSKYEGCHAKAR